ncbi:uncharacterized protein ATNIH1004_010634 [Aspergillus tanneri]|uniref:Uncharacterized protein n=1 Tax=Aspergillus tanneri TaxID=1220188 RepID=A0A5M9MHB8_9EURO|nr:uncharacterized protein ATNIH1004_010634 [Aspergillus tanneri]KAA8643859.1 hypothetical protein ATNIH1004_010634 [Aspergillus tanneri]
MPQSTPVAFQFGTAHENSCISLEQPQREQCWKPLVATRWRRGLGRAADAFSDRRLGGGNSEAAGATEVVGDTGLKLGVKLLEQPNGVCEVENGKSKLAPLKEQRVKSQGPHGLFYSESNIGNRQEQVQ